jgi:hypothetical protein
MSRDEDRSARRAAHEAVSGALSRLDDQGLREILDTATPCGSGIGGVTLLLEVACTPVFVKQVRLTDLERLPQHVGSTANLFGLPVFCHYGVGVIGGPGCGAWRELAAHTMTTRWVLEGDHDGFPLLYHWRVLEDAGRPLPEELADVDRAVAYWGGGPQVRRRLEALESSTASLVLFLEHVPHTLHDWLAEQLAAGGEGADRALAMVDDQLGATVDFMGQHGLQHLDTHFRNVLTDGNRLYLTDFGLAMSADFELDVAEVDFFAAHRTYDRCYTATHLVNWLVVALFGLDPHERRELVHACAQGAHPSGMPPGITAVLARHAPTAHVMGDFFRRFQATDGRTSAVYPHELRDDTPPPDGRPVDGQSRRNMTRR